MEIEQQQWSCPFCKPLQEQVVALKAELKKTITDYERELKAAYQSGKSDQYWETEQAAGRE